MNYETALIQYPNESKILRDTFINQILKSPKIHDILTILKENCIFIDDNLINFLNYKSADSNHLCIETCSPIDVLRMYDSNILHQFAKIFTNFPSGIFVLDFILLNIYILPFPLSKKWMFVIHGLKELFKIILAQTKPIINTIIINNLIGQTGGSLLNIADNASEIEYMARIKIDSRDMNLEELISRNLTSIPITFEQFFEFFTLVDCHCFFSPCFIKEISFNKNRSTTQLDHRTNYINSSILAEKNILPSRKVYKLFQNKNKKIKNLSKNGVKNLICLRNLNVFAITEWNSHEIYLYSCKRFALKKVITSQFYGNTHYTIAINTISYCECQQILGALKCNGALSFWFIKNMNRELIIFEEFNFKPNDTPALLYSSKYLKNFLTTHDSNVVTEWKVKPKYKEFLKFKKNSEKEIYFKESQAVNLTANKKTENIKNFLPESTIIITTHSKILTILEIFELKCLAISCSDKKIYVYNCENMKFLYEIIIKDSYIYCLCYISRWKYLLGAKVYKDISIQQLSDFQDFIQMPDLIDHQQKIVAIESFENLDIFVSADSTNILKVWDLPTMKCIQTIEFKSFPINQLVKITETDLCVITQRVRFFSFVQIGNLKNFVEVCNKENDEKNSTPILSKILIDHRFEQNFIISANNLIFSIKSITGNISQIYNIGQNITQHLITDITWIHGINDHFVVATENGYIILCQASLNRSAIIIPEFYGFYIEDITNLEQDYEKDESVEKKAQKYFTSHNMSWTKKYKLKHKMEVKTSFPKVPILRILYDINNLNLILVSNYELSVVQIQSFQSFVLLRNVKLHKKQIADDITLKFEDAEFSVEFNVIIGFISKRILILLNYSTLEVISVHFIIKQEVIRQFHTDIFNATNSPNRAPSQLSKPQKIKRFSILTKSTSNLNIKDFLKIIPPDKFYGHTLQLINSFLVLNDKSIIIVFDDRNVLSFLNIENLNCLFEVELSHQFDLNKFIGLKLLLFCNRNLKDEILIFEDDEQNRSFNSLTSSFSEINSQKVESNYENVSNLIIFSCNSGKLLFINVDDHIKRAFNTIKKTNQLLNNSHFFSLKNTKPSLYGSNNLRNPYSRNKSVLMKLISNK